MKVVPFQADHLALLVPQPAQRDELAALSRPEARALEMAGGAWTVVCDGAVVACGGIAPQRWSRALLWAFLGVKAGRHLLSVFRAARRILALSEYARIETTVRADFDAGHRWIKLLGFELETPDGMKRFGPKGEKYMLYSRTR